MLINWIKVFAMFETKTTYFNKIVAFFRKPMLVAFIFFYSRRSNFIKLTADAEIHSCPLENLGGSIIL